MKLSLYMIANKLEYLTPIIQIFEVEDQVYISCTTTQKRDNYIYIQQHNNDSYIYGQYPDSYIMLKNTDIVDAQTLVLDIFDEYNEQIEKITYALDEDDYQALVDICYDLFNAPCFILSKNNKLIAMNSQTGIEDLDNPEWKHLKEHGYSSLQNYIRFKEFFKRQESQFNCKAVYCKSPPTSDRTSFMISMLCMKQIVYGRITIMEYFRKFNEGDVKLLEFISGLIARHMYLTNLENRDNGFIIVDFILENEITREDIDHIMEYYSWSEGDIFKAMVIDGSFKEDELKLAKEYIDSLFPDCLSAINDNKIVLTFNENKYKSQIIINKIKDSYIGKLNLRYGFSLEFSNLENIKIYYEQALYAIKHATDKGNTTKISDFYNYALDFILSSNNTKEKIFACNPSILRLLQKSESSDHEILNTLYIYLISERKLVKASDILHIHRNTLLYRINNMSKIIKCDLDDAYTREYIIISIRYLVNNLL